jgi:hypothetical protein
VNTPLAKAPLPNCPYTCPTSMSFQPEGRVVTFCVRIADVLLLSFVSPPKAAVIECDPNAKVDVLYVAVPLLTVPVPSVVFPSMNVTVPVAVVGTTVAVNVTEKPYTDGFEDGATVTVVFALFTVCVRTADVLLL